MGTVMNIYGAQIYRYYHGGYSAILDPTISLAFAGSFIACLFWVSHTGLVPRLMGRSQGTRLSHTAWYNIALLAW